MRVMLVENVARNLADSINYCAGLGLRLPTWSEAVAMAKNYNAPGVSDVADSFWTDTLTNGSFQQQFGAIVVEERRTATGQSTSADRGRPSV